MITHLIFASTRNRPLRRRLFCFARFAWGMLVFAMIFSTITATIVHDSSFLGWLYLFTVELVHIAIATTLFSVSLLLLLNSPARTLRTTAIEQSLFAGFGSGLWHFILWVFLSIPMLAFDIPLPYMIPLYLPLFLSGVLFLTFRLTQKASEKTYGFPLEPTRVPCSGKGP